jgi:hypothetical protein
MRVSELSNAFDQVDADINAMRSTIDDLKGEAISHKAILNGLRFVRRDVEYRMGLVDQALAILSDETKSIARRLEKLEMKDANSQSL